MNKIKNRLRVSGIFFMLLFFMVVSCAGGKKKIITILETTDVHGVILPYDFVEKENLKASLSAVSSYIKKVRNENTTLFLLDNGDNLQGQPEVYYYNFIGSVSPHFNAEAMNYLGYDACTAGNHDIETGHSVYDKLVKEYHFPLLAANAVNKKTGKPYFKPYTIIEKNGVRVAVFGLITSAVPEWLPPALYAGIEFKDMVETAKIWMPVILKENPDLIVGMFHSGWNEMKGRTKTEVSSDENGSSEVAWAVPGFDVILTGHDHKIHNGKFVNSAGDTVLILNGGSRAEKIARADIIISSRKIKGKKQKILKGTIINTADYKPDNDFVKKFTAQDKLIMNYVNKIITNSEVEISSRDSYFGSSVFVDMIHQEQLNVTHADISFAAPLSFDVKISKGPVTVGDMFKLYRFENMLYTMSLSGKEVKDYLEYSYSEWLNTMKGPGDLLLKMQVDKSGKPVLTNGKPWLKNQPFNFDSAAGIDYSVDVSKPEGKRILIKSFSDGRPFDLRKKYKVAVNSYRGNGGGGHLIAGAGIKKDELPDRLISSTEKDLRFYIMKDLESKRTIRPQPLNNWRIVPLKWVKAAKAREYKLLFGN